MRPLRGKVRRWLGWDSRLVATTPMALLVGLPLRVSVLRRALLRLRLLGLAVSLLPVRLGPLLELVGRWPAAWQG